MSMIDTGPQPHRKPVGVEITLYWIDDDKHERHSICTDDHTPVFLAIKNTINKIEAVNAAELAKIGQYA